MLALILPPSAISAPLEAAVLAAAEACGVPAFVDGAPDWAGATPPARWLAVCADASVLGDQVPWRTVVCLGDPVGGPTRAEERYALAPRDAMALCARCLAAAADWAAQHKAAILSQQQIDDDGEAFLMQLFELLDLEVDGEALVRIADKFSRQVLVDLPTSGRPERDALLGLAASADGLLGPAKSEWPRTLFLAGQPPHDPCPPEIDLTGGARILLFGPQLHLRAGRWRVVARFELADDGGRVPLLLEFGDVSSFAQHLIKPTGDGLYEIAIEHAWPTTRPVALRFSTARAAFHGALRFSGASVERA